MKTARVLGSVTLNRALPELKPGRYVLAEVLDAAALSGVKRGVDTGAAREAPMSESLVVFDNLGASPGQLIAVSEGREACVPFEPDRVPIDAYCAAILDTIES